MLVSRLDFGFRVRVRRVCVCVVGGARWSLTSSLMVSPPSESDEVKVEWLGLEMGSGLEQAGKQTDSHTDGQKDRQSD